jgi:hypothetical protein
MSESKKTYMEESLWEVEHFLARENINRNLLDETLIDDMAYHYYKNYYYYEMDDEFALRAAVSVVLEENNITIDGFEMWIP